MDVKYQPVSIGSYVKDRNWASTAVIVMLLIALGFLLFYRLDVSPAPHFDEGAFLKVAKNFALNGVYADYSYDGDRYTGAVVSTGPTVILPIAAVFKLTGVTILGGRVVAVTYACLMLAALYFVAERLVDRRLAFAAVVLAIITPNLNFVEFSRTVMGELPGMFFMFTGLLLWFVAAKRGIWFEVLAGVFFGLACVTKNQYAMFILPGIGISFLLNLVYYRRRAWHYYVIPGVLAAAFYAGWTYYVLFQLGAASRDVAYDVAHLRSMTSASFFLLDSESLNNNLTYLLADPFLLPALAFGFIRLFDRNDSNEQHWSAVFMFALFASVMFILSDGWSRYAILPVGLILLLEARLLYTLTNGFRFRWAQIEALLRRHTVSYTAVVGILIVGLVVSTYARPFYLQVRNVLSGGSDGIYRLARYVDENVPADAVIATWETETSLLNERIFHNPPYTVFVELQSRRAHHESVENLYSFPEHVNAEYILIGSQAKNLQLYEPAQLSNYVLIYTAGDYDLYQRRTALDASQNPSDESLESQG